MQYIKSYNEFEPINEKLVYVNGTKTPFKKKQTKDDLKRVGYLELVSVPGIGDFVAKFDSGNGSSSSITCDEWHDNGDYIIWKLNGIEIKSKKYGKNVVFNRNNEERVLIELDIEFDGNKYEKVPFGLANRDKNYAKMLINRTFANTCHAIIDTGNAFICTKRPKDFSVNNKSKYSGIYFYDNNEEE